MSASSSSSPALLLALPHRTRGIILDTSEVKLPFFLSVVEVVDLFETMMKVKTIFISSNKADTLRRVERAKSTTVPNTQNQLESYSSFHNAPIFNDVTSAASRPSSLQNTSTFLSLSLSSVRTPSYGAFFLILIRK